MGSSVGFLVSYKHWALQICFLYESDHSNTRASCEGSHDHWSGWLAYLAWHNVHIHIIARGGIFLKAE